MNNCAVEATGAVAAADGDRAAVPRAVSDAVVPPSLPLSTAVVMSAADATGTVPSRRHTRNFRAASRQNPCPFCHHADWCRVFADGDWECMRTPNDHPCSSGGWMYWPGGRRPTDWCERIAALPAQPARPLVDVAVADCAYHVLLNRCPLSDGDRAGLHARGLTDAEIVGHFGTMCTDPLTRSRIVTVVADAIGCDPAGVVPGFVRERGQTDLVSTPGMFVVGFTADGLLGSIQIRVTNPGGVANTGISAPAMVPAALAPTGISSTSHGHSVLCPRSACC
jgi:hypothetical protein